MELILMRHALAEKSHPDRYPDDDLRPLTENGLKRQRKIAKALRIIDLKPNLIISSPRLRAHQTAIITAEQLRPPKGLILNDVLGTNYTPHAVLDMLSTLNLDEVVMLVGHEPDLSVVGGLLLGPHGGPMLNFRKSAVLGLYFPDAPQPGEGTLEFFWQAEHLLALV